MNKSFLKRYDLTPATLFFLIVLATFFALFLAYPIAYVFSEAFYVNSRLLFSVDLEHQSELDNGNISGDLLQKFESYEFSLSQDAVVSVKGKDDGWLITDNKKKFHIRKKDDELNIYSSGKFSVHFFKLMFTNPLMRKSIFNSVIIGVVVTLATTLLSLPLSYFLVRYRFRGRSLLQGLILVPMVMPPFVGAKGMKLLFARFGSVNLILMKLHIIEQQNAIDWFGGGLLAVIILEVLHLYPIMYLNIAASLANIDPSLEEAAESMGAGKFRLFRTITLPLMLPGYFAGAIIVFIWAFTDLGTPLVFEYRKVIPIRIYDMVNEPTDNPMGFALVVLVILMTMAFFYLSKRFMGTKRYEMMSRGHTDVKERSIGIVQTILIYVFILSVIGIAVLPHISVALLSVTERWAQTILPSKITAVQYAKSSHTN